MYESSIWNKFYNFLVNICNGTLYSIDEEDIKYMESQKTHTIEMDRPFVVQMGESISINQVNQNNYNLHLKKLEKQIQDEIIIKCMNETIQKEKKLELEKKRTENDWDVIQ